MKPFNFLFVFIFVLLSSGCRTLSYFESPNNLRNLEGTLLLHNGKTVDGRLVIETENIFSSPVRVYADGDKKPMRFGLNEVKGFSLRNETYVLKEIREGLSIGRRQYFMKQLTRDSSRIHLYEFLSKETINKTATRHEPEFYVELPNEEPGLVFAANGSRFVPHFEEKVSRLVSDCPALAEKIADKRPGYFYAQVSLLKERRAEVLLKIIDEYNACRN